MNNSKSSTRLTSKSKALEYWAGSDFDEREKRPQSTAKNWEYSMKELSLPATKAVIPQITATLNSGLTLEIEISQFDQVRKVYKWGNRLLERTREWEAPQWEQHRQAAPDLLMLQVKPEGGPRAVAWKDVGLEDEEEQSAGLILTEFKTQVQALIFLESDRLFAKVDSDYLALDGSEEVVELVRQRQQETPVELGADFYEWCEMFDQGASSHLRAKQPPILKNEQYNFSTGLESDWLLRAASDGSRGYRKDEQRGALIREFPGTQGGSASHRIELQEDAPDGSGEVIEMELLETLVGRQNADFGFAFFYVCRLLAPPSPLKPNLFAGGWIDLDDVAEKIGYDVDGCTAPQREELRAQVWDFIQYGARAIVIGRRKDYYDIRTKQLIETQVESPPWRILEIERPVQTAMFGETPRRVQLLVSKQWEPLLVAASLAQYLPCAEIVGSIPTKQTAGAWARVIGMALANFWRRNPHEVIPIQVEQKADEIEAAPIRPTRRELLERYTPKTTLRAMPPLEMLESKDPKRAVKYWCDALALLKEKGIIAPEGESLRTVRQMLESFPRQGWKDLWLDEKVDLSPGSAIVAAVKERAKAKPRRKPRGLNAPKSKSKTK